MEKPATPHHTLVIELKGDLLALPVQEGAG